MYEMMIEKTAGKNFTQYEISNFSRAGFESKHNSKYWLCEPVFAFGVSAHSFDGKARRANERDTNAYVSLVENGESAIVYREEIDLASEFVFLGLRMMRGVDLAAYEQKFGVDLLSKYAVDLERLRSLGLIEIVEDRLRLTSKGALFSNEVFAAFV